MEIIRLKLIIEAALFAAGEPLAFDRLLDLFLKPEQPSRQQLMEALEELVSDYRGRGVQLKQVATGYCFQTCPSLSSWVRRLWPEKPVRYSRAFLETLSVIAYKQPVTRGDIEAIRGVSLKPQLIKALLEKGWVTVAGQREVPGRPDLYVTSRRFLDYFGLKDLSGLPVFTEIDTKKKE